MPNKKYSKRGNQNKKDYERYDKKRFNRSAKERDGSQDVPNHNDWSFYAASDEIARGIASIPFNYLGGTKFPLGELNDQKPLPCVLTIPYINSIGVTSKGTEGVNMAAAQLYTYIRHTNSGAKNYEAADVMMYVIALRDTYAQYFNLRKLIGLCSSFNFYNHNLPDMIIEGMGVNAEDLRSNLANYRTQLNILAKKLNSFAAPKYFKVFDRTAFINSFIFTDSSSIRGQFYNFVPAGKYTWSPKTSERGTELVYTPHQWNENEAPFTFVPKTFQFYLDSLKSQLDALFLDTDALTMSGDILKAFPNAELYSVGQIPDDYQTSFVMDEDILAQIENMRSMPLASYMSESGSTGFTYDINIKQVDQLIKYEPKFVFTNVKNFIPSITSVPQVLINSHKDEPDYKDVLEWTRLVSTFDVTLKELTPETGDPKTEYTLNVVTSGLELPLGYCISSDGRTTCLLSQWDNITPATPLPTTADVYMAWKKNASRILTDLSMLSKFDWHPTKYVGYIYTPGDIGSEKYEPLAWFCDVKVAVTIPVETMDRINDSAIYGSFYSNSMYNNT